MSFLNILAKKGLISQDDIPKIESISGQTGQSIEDVLAKMNIASDSVLNAKGEYLDIATRVIGEEGVSFDILKYISEDSARHYNLVPLDFKDGVLEVGLVNPDDLNARNSLNFIASKLGVPFKIFLISKEDFNRVVSNYKGISNEVDKALGNVDSKLIEEISDIKLEEKSEVRTGKNGEETVIIEDAPVTKVVDTILRYAVDGVASDVHIEPLRQVIRVRFRVDGLLNTSLVLPITYHQAVVARIKVMCDMKLDEKRKPQDGRLTRQIDGRKIDFRVSTFPSYFGEKVVLRILDQEKGVKPLSEIGLDPKIEALVREAIKRPYGLILISGPTGSGKTTTLYSMLNELDREGTNVLSLEDPIEYNIEGVSQSQVFPDIGYTFATGLRTTLRQDPDVIMVGEIRDKETAKLAVQAALTGHLVLSTIHTNNSVGVIPRLIDMGVDPYLIGPTLILAMAQRLVNVICPETNKKVPVDGAIKAIIDRQFADLPEKYLKEIKIPETVLEIEPSPTCPLGTKGRAAVFEAFKMEKDVEELILKNPTELGIYELLRSKGMLMMKEDAIRKAFKGEISFEEVNKL
ncbi:MAG: GspE/PulE family protein [Minisyncoccia bacterium]